MRRTRKVAIPASRDRGETQELTSPQARVYVACPKAEYDGDRYRTMLAHVRRLYPGAQLIEPARLYHSLDDWQRRWPEVLRGISHFVFFTTPDGWVGRGVYSEIQAAIARQVPVAYLTSDGTVVQHERLHFRIADEGNWKRYCCVSNLPQQE